MLADVGGDVGTRARPGPDVSLRRRLPALDRYGVAVEWFEHYVNPDLRLHALDVVLLTVVVAGTGRHVLGEEERATTGPCLDVSRLGEPHSLVTGPGGMDVVNVYLADDRPPSPRFGDGLDERLALVIPPPAPFGVPADRLRRWEIDDLDGLLVLVRELDAEIRHGGPGARAAVEARLTLLLLHCAREVERAGLVQNPPTGRSARGVEAVRHYLDGHYDQEHTLAQLAARANLERTSFSRAFSAHVGIPVFRYLNQQRVRAAARLLRDTDLPIARIAGQVGFGDLSHFHRTFKDVVGTSPRRFREEAR